MFLVLLVYLINVFLITPANTCKMYFSMFLVLLVYLINVLFLLLNEK